MESIGFDQVIGVCWGAPTTPVAAISAARWCPSARQPCRRAAAGGRLRHRYPSTRHEHVRPKASPGGRDDHHIRSLVSERRDWLAPGQTGVTAQSTVVHGAVSGRPRVTATRGGVERRYSTLTKVVLGLSDVGTTQRP